MLIKFIKNHFLLLMIVLLGIVFRFYKLAEYPIHLSHDEISQLYDAMSVLKTGRDIHGNYLPFIFPSIGDFKPPFYTYASIIPVWLLRGREISIRIVGAFFGVLMIPAVYYFALKLFGKKEISLFASLATAIAPFEIHFSRKGFEGGAGVVTILVGFGLLLSFVKDRKDKYFILGSAVLALGAYTYFSHAILIPILYFMFLILFREEFTKKQVLGIILFLAILTPLIVFINTDQNSTNRARAVFITQDPVLNELITKNSKINKNIVIGKYILIRYIDQLNPTFLFLNGLDLTNQDPIDMGPLYFFQLPVVILGVFFILKKFHEKKLTIFILSWIFIGLIPSGLTFERHSPHRVIMYFTMLNILSAVGVFYVLTLINEYKLKWVSLLLKSSVVLMGIWSVGYFIYIYTVQLPIDKSEYIQYPFKEVAKIARNNYNNYDQIIIDPKFGKYAPWVGAASYYYLAYYGNYPVEKIQKELSIGKNGKSEITFGKYVIRNVYWPVDKDLKDVLIIASPWVISKGAFGKATLLNEIKSYQGNDVVFYVLSLK